MKTNSLLLLFLLIIGLGVRGQGQEMATLTVKVTDIEAVEGEMKIGLYASEDNWLRKTYAGKSVKISRNTCEVVFAGIPYGEYAISIYQDKNTNGKLDMNGMGIPKEKSAASNQAPAFFGPPKWKRAAFNITKNEQTITIKLKP